MFKNTTACPLDCYDACEIVYEDEKITAKKDGHTQGFLCPHLNHYDKHQRIIFPRYKGEEISIDEALLKLKEILSASLKSEILHYRSNGNFALMQEVTDHFFAQYGACLTDGTLCDGAGEAGIVAGRGSNKNMPLSELKKSEVVIFWGRNPHVTSSHLLPIIKDKTIIVIDPVATKIAKNADLYVQIKPHTDIFLAMLLTRFLYINDGCDEEYLSERGSEFEDYYELTQSIRIKTTLENIGVSLGQIGSIIEMVKGRKVAIVCGVGIQKYADGADAMRAIDAFAVALGLFGKDGCGVSYLGNSKEAIVSPFNIKAKRVSKVNTQFDDFKTVFVQGANPLSQMPNTQRVKTSISRTQNVIYFGLYENETSEIANLVIPAKNFLEKYDIRTSYSHNSMIFMNQQVVSDIGISEYELSSFLCQEFEIELKSEQEYLNHFKSFSIENDATSFEVKNIQKVPYKDSFDTDDGEFLFLDEIDTNQVVDDRFHLITPKNNTSLNSQFKRDEFAYLHSSLGFNENEMIEISSPVGKVSLRVKCNDNVREDCILIYSGTKGLNNLTSSKHSYEGKCAIYQEERVSVSIAELK